MARGGLLGWLEDGLDYWAEVFDISPMNPKPKKKYTQTVHNPKNKKQKKRFTFHGGFASKEDAVKKEKEVGGFIRHKNGRYYVIKES